MKPTITELEKILNDDTKKVTLNVDGTVTVEDSDSPDVIIRNLRDQIGGLQLKNSSLNVELICIKEWIKTCPFKESK